MQARHTLLLDGASLPARELVGGKAWSLARMRALGLNVPPAFVVTTETCKQFHESGGVMPAGLMDEVMAGVAWLEKTTGRRLGAAQRPLLVSVRSGAPVSMPGMMDTVLNLGMSDDSELALARETGAPGFARDTHRRFCEMFARIVLRAEIGALDPSDGPAGWRAAIAARGCGEVPADPAAQLESAIRAVFHSWNGRRARKYRQHHGVPEAMGTAVTVQAMVFGNSDERSGTGVLFSRNPLTGDPVPYGEYLARAQGEDVVSGSHTPEGLDALARRMPEVHRELLSACAVLERDNGDVQDIEFTVERGRLYLLQARPAKRSPAAAVRCAVDMVREGRIGPPEALSRVSAEQVRLLLRPRLPAGFDPSAASVLARGEAASPGVGAGVVAADADEAERLHALGHAVVLARPTTSPEDVHGMLVAAAIATEKGGSTSHAAVVSRQLGVPCVVGCGEGALAGLAGRMVTVDGTSGRVFEGALPVEQPSAGSDPALAALLEWASAEAPLRVLPAGCGVPRATLDLDAIEGGEDPARTAGLLAGTRGASGSVFNTDAGVHAAVEAGLEFIVVREVLPALLAACAARRHAAAAA
ncbi:MAG: pyruvate, phosphate dikinase [Betaproteobacteria bacterium]